MVDGKTRLCDATLDDLVEFLKAKGFQQEDTQGDAQYNKIYGIDGLAQFLGVHYNTALKIKSSGKLDGAYIQSGRTVVFNENKVRKCLGEEMARRGRS